MSEIDHIQAGIFDINGIMRGKDCPRRIIKNYR